MEPFHHAIRLGVVGGGGGDADSQLLEGRVPQLRGELGTPICRNRNRDPEARNPMLLEGLEEGVGCRVGDRDCFDPARGPVDHRQKVPFVLVRRERSNHVQMDVSEAFGGCGDWQDRRDRVSGDLARRASLALSRPAEDVSAHAGPNVRPGDDGEGGLAGGVREVVYRREDLSAMSVGDENAGPAERRVADDRGVDAGETNGFQTEGGGRFLLDGALRTGELGQADVGEGVRDGVYHCRLLFVVVLSCQGVSDDVLESGHVRDVRRELADEGELMTLSV